MTSAEKLAMTKSLLGISSTDTSCDDTIATFLSVAEQEILSWRYSYGSAEVTEVPPEYEMTQIYAVIAGFSQRGAENQLQHTENGISAQFEFSDMIRYVRANVIPICKVL